MKNIFNLIAKLIVLGCIVVGSGLIYNSFMAKDAEKSVAQNSKAVALKNYLVKFKKPKRIEINNLTERLAKDVEDIKKINVSLDPQSKFYISITLFTDENDQQAPLIAQVSFMDLESENKIKEENINLD